MARIGNAPKQSLEVRLYHALLRRPSGVSRQWLDNRFRKEAAGDLDSALLCLQSTGLARCTDGLWWAK